MGAGSGTYGEYLSAIGLGYEPEKVVEHTTGAQAIAKAEAILEKARERI